MKEPRNSRPDEDTKLRRAIDEGVEITGGAIGGALGVIAGDPALAGVLGAAGIAAGSALRHVGNEIVGPGAGAKGAKAGLALLSRLSLRIFTRAHSVAKK